MATMLYLTATPSDVTTGGQTYSTLAIGTRGPAASATSVSIAETTNPGAAGTSSMTLVPSGTVAYWATKPLATAVTIAGTIAVNYWGGASSGTNCVDFQCFKLSGGSVSSVAVFTTSINVSQQTGPTRQISNIKPTSTAFAAGDRIVLLGNVNTSGATNTGVSTLGYNGNIENADGDSWILFAEDITTTVAQGPAYLRGPSIQHLETLRYYTASVSSISTAQLVSGDAKLEAFLNELAAQRDLQGA